MSKFKSYKGYAVFIAYSKENEASECRAEIFANAALLDCSDWEKTEDKAFDGAFKIIDKWFKQKAGEI